MYDHKKEKPDELGEKETLLARGGVPWLPFEHNLGGTGAYSIHQSKKDLTKNKRKKNRAGHLVKSKSEKRNQALGMSRHYFEEGEVGRQGQRLERNIAKRGRKREDVRKKELHRLSWRLRLFLQGVLDLTVRGNHWEREGGTEHLWGVQALAEILAAG